jgi:hypothetical protein
MFMLGYLFVMAYLARRNMRIYVVDPLLKELDQWTATLRQICHADAENDP